VHGEAQTHHEVESRIHMCVKAQGHPSDPCMTDRWQETTRHQECQIGNKYQRANQRKLQS
jgi:hypothetical protein